MSPTSKSICDNCVTMKIVTRNNTRREQKNKNLKNSSERAPPPLPQAHERDSNEILGTFDLRAMTYQGQSNTLKITKGIGVRARPIRGSVNADAKTGKMEG